MNIFLFDLLIITARKRSLRRLCFYTCLSVILFTGKVGLQLGGLHPGRGVCSQVDLHPGGLHLVGLHPAMPDPALPPSDTKGYGQQAAVRILLECILVSQWF